MRHSNRSFSRPDLKPHPIAPSECVPSRSLINGHALALDLLLVGAFLTGEGALGTVFLAYSFLIATGGFTRIVAFGTLCLAAASFGYRHLSARAMVVLGFRGGWRLFLAHIGTGLRCGRSLCVSCLRECRKSEPGREQRHQKNQRYFFHPCPSP